ncbi:MAG: DUF5110 domain-containing protein [Bacteroidaceae bacterium]|nr:DUF5110 domain-containing protein [Bacteroidaceae bacterium]
MCYAMNIRYRFAALIAVLMMCIMPTTKVSAQVAVDRVEQLSAQDRVTIQYVDGSKKQLAFYAPNIFRVFQTADGSCDLRDPKADPPAEILVADAKKDVGKINITADAGQASYIVSTSAVKIVINRTNGLMTVYNIQVPDEQPHHCISKYKDEQLFRVWGDKRPVLEELEPARIDKGKVSLVLKAGENEYFYGGGVQNGRFSHRGTAINIVNENSWTDGGVCSPAPFFWSNGGYGLMAYTFSPGCYDFGSKEADKVVLTHETDYIDYFVMVDDTPVKLLNDYWQLTGHPVLLPKFGFYEGHLNAYNRDYWKEETPEALAKSGADKFPTVFEDGKYYREDQKDNGGIRESLNGELEGNYQFSARAVVDRYKAQDMPLGWVLPNDGYGAGYGQTATLDGNVQNLKEFGDYARKNGVEIGLWTQSDLHPIDTIAPLLQRDIVKEIRDAGVRVLKTDVAWVGAGYSFGLNGISDVANLMPKYGNNARPFIISLDGWTATQRYAGIWSGDQTGGKWEYIRFHIPTFIGSGLSGQPNITSDMDGIFGGRNVPVNVREFQWKTFTPMQLNMDGWGSNAKYPHALGEPATSINRAYLKMKSMLMPYTYSIAHEAIDGKPMIRPVFLDETDTYQYSLGKATQYEYLYGPSFLVAPVYQDTKADTLGNDVRHNIYLPRCNFNPVTPAIDHTNWIDYFDSDALYYSGRVLNSHDAPLWKLPVFVKSGSIIPMTTAHNNPNEIDHGLRIYEIYPGDSACFVEYDDDGVTEAYRNGEYVTTKIWQNLCGKKQNIINVTVEPTEGGFSGFQKEKTTVFRIVVDKEAAGLMKKIVVTVGGKKVKLTEVKSLEEFEASTGGVYFIGYGVDYTRFFTDESLKDIPMKAAYGFNVKLPKTDVTRNKVNLQITLLPNRSYEPIDRVELPAPTNVGVKDADRKPYSLKLSWDKVPGAENYEIEFDKMTYFNILDNEFLFEDLKPDTEYKFSVRACKPRYGAVIRKTYATARTATDPFEHAVKGVTATCTAPSQPGQGLDKLFDFDPESQWHTNYDQKAVPFEMVIDLHSVNTLSKMQYLPRNYGYNGIITSGSVAVSMNMEQWTDCGTFQWDRDAMLKEIDLNGHQARYIKLSVNSAYGDFGSGQDIYIFRQPGSSYYIPGDINNDGVLDENDLTSYMNYTGLRQGDADFEGYVSNGDINGNGLIDAYDISNAAIGMMPASISAATLGGEISVETNKSTYKAGEEVVVTVKGKDLSSVNAFSLALPYSEKQLEFVAGEPVAANDLRNFSRDRLHTNGQKGFYVTFVGVGDTMPLLGDVTLCTLRFKAKAAGPVRLQPRDIILVDKQLRSIVK